MAGGTDVLVWMNRRRSAPSTWCTSVVSTSCVTSARTADTCASALSATQAELAASRLVYEKATALALAARSCAGPPVRNLATIGGNLATATPAGDLILAVAALDGKVRVRGPQGERQLALDEFLIGPQQTSLAPDELIIEVLIPVPAGRSGSGFQKLGRRKAMTISTASAAASVVVECRRQDF